MELSVIWCSILVRVHTNNSSVHSERRRWSFCGAFTYADVAPILTGRAGAFTYRRTVPLMAPT